MPKKIVSKLGRCDDQVLPEKKKMTRSCSKGATRKDLDSRRFMYGAGATRERESESERAREKEGYQRLPLSDTEERIDASGLASPAPNTLRLTPGCACGAGAVGRGDQHQSRARHADGADRQACPALFRHPAGLEVSRPVRGTSPLAPGRSCHRELRVGGIAPATRRRARRAVARPIAPPTRPLLPRASPMDCVRKREAEAS